MLGGAQSGMTLNRNSGVGFEATPAECRSVHFGWGKAPEPDAPWTLGTVLNGAEASSLPESRDRVDPVEVKGGKNGPLAWQVDGHPPRGPGVAFECPCRRELPWNGCGRSLHSKGDRCEDVREI